MESSALRRYFHWYWDEGHARARRPLDHERFLAAEGLLPERCLVEPAGLRVLEIGPGAGRTVRALAQGGARVIAVDLCAPHLRSHVPAALCGGRGEQLPLRRASVDAVIVQTTAMHLRIEALFAEVRRVLRPGGFFVLLEPQPYHPVVALYRLLLSAGRGSSPRYLSRRDLGLLVASFPVTRISYHGLFSPLLPVAQGRRARQLDAFLIRRLGWTRRLAWFVFAVARRY